MAILQMEGFGNWSLGNYFEPSLEASEMGFVFESRQGTSSSNSLGRVVDLDGSYAFEFSKGSHSSTSFAASLSCETPPRSQFGMGFSVLLSGTLDSGTEPFEIVVLGDSSELVSIRPTSDYKLKVVMPSGDYESSENYVGGFFNFVEFFIDGNADTFELRIGGSEVLQVSSAGFSADDAKGFRIGTRPVSYSNLRVEMDITNIVIWDKEPGSVTDFTGPVKVQAVYPDAVGAVNEWTTEGAADPMAALSTPYGDDTSYITASSDKTIELEFPDLDPNLEVLGVKYQFNTGVDAPQARQLSAGFGTPSDPQSAASTIGYLAPVVKEVTTAEYADPFIIYSGSS